MSSRLIDPDFVRRAMDIRRIGARAVRKAQEENRRLGIPNAYMINGHIYYEMPDGTLRLKCPEE